MPRVLSIPVVVIALVTLMVAAVFDLGVSDHDHEAALTEHSICLEWDCTPDKTAECGTSFGHCSVFLYKPSHRQSLIRDCWAQDVLPERDVLLVGMVPETSRPPPRV